MRDKMSARRRALLMFFLLVMFGALAVGYLLTFHLDTVRRIVQQQMLDAFGQNLKVGEVQITFFPFPRLTLTNLQILESEQGKPFFQASRIQMNLSFRSVFQDEVIPKGLMIEDPKVYLRRNEQGQWNTESIVQSQPADSTGVGAFLTGYTLTLENGFIQIVDEFEATKPEVLELNNVEMHISNLSTMQPMDVLLSANLNDDSASNLSIEGTVSEVYDFFSISQTTEKPVGPHVDARARLELKQADLFQLARLFHIDDLPKLSHGRIQVQSQIQYAPDREGYELTLSDVMLLTNTIDLQGKVNISRLMTSVPPAISATWSNAPMTIPNILTMIPAHLIPDEVQAALKDHPLNGKLEVVSATVSSSNGEGAGFDLTGEFELSEGSVDLGKTWGVTENVQGTVFLQPDRIQLKNFKGIYDSIPVSSGIGEIEFRDNGPWLSTELKGLVPSKKLINILRMVFGWTHPDHAMSGFVGEKGGGTMMIRFSGPLQQPERISVAQARYDPEQVTLQFPGFERPIENVSGTVIFSSRHVSFTSLKGVLGSSPMTLEGIINFQDSAVFDNLQLTGRVSTKDLPTQLGEFSIPFEEVISGTAIVAVTLSGPIDRPRIQTLWDLEELVLNIKGMFHKNLKVKGTLDADLEFREPQGIKVHRMTLALPPLTLSGSGSFDGPKTGQFTASVTASPFDPLLFPVGLTVFDGALKKGLMEFSVNVTGKGHDWRQWRKDGWMALTDGVIPLEGLNSPLSKVFLRLKLSRHDAEVKRLQFHMQESEALIGGSMINWDTSPKVKLVMTAPQFDLDLLVPKGDRSPLRDVLESIAATQTVGGTITFARAWYKNMKFQDLQGRLRIKNGFVGVDQITGKTESGKLEGRFLIHLPVQQPATVKTWINMEDIPFKTLQTTFLSAEDLEERLWTGTFTLRGMVQGHGKDHRGVFPSLNGDLKILVRDGRIQRGTVIPKMLALMNLPAVLQGKVDLKKDGYPFDKQSATLTIRNGVVASEDIFMDGPILKLTGAGTYNLVDDQLDLALAASPLGAYFDLLEKVSLFRILLESDKKNSHIALFDVKGPLNDPVIKPLPLESFKAGLKGFTRAAFNVLKNTVALPKNILFPKKDEDSELRPNSSTSEGP